MRIYLDNCSLQRPLDDQTQPRIERETEAIIAILFACEIGDLTLVSSEILLAEINNAADLERRETTLGVLDIERLSSIQKSKNAPGKLKNPAPSQLMRCILPVRKREKPNISALATINF